MFSEDCFLHSSNGGKLKSKRSIAQTFTLVMAAFQDKDKKQKHSSELVFCQTSTVCIWCFYFMYYLFVYMWNWRQMIFFFFFFEAWKKFFKIKEQANNITEEILLSLSNGANLQRLQNPDLNYCVNHMCRKQNVHHDNYDHHIV